MGENNADTTSDSVAEFQIKACDGQPQIQKRNCQSLYGKIYENFCII